MTRHRLLIWSLLGTTVVLGFFVQKTRQLVGPSQDVPQSGDIIPASDGFAPRDFPAEWRAPDSTWDLFTPPMAETKSPPEMVKEGKKTQPNIIVDGYIIVGDSPTYVILQDTARERAYRLMRQEPIPDTNFTIIDFYFDGPNLLTAVSDEKGQHFVISGDCDVNASSPTIKNTP
ncbi:MAG: hypothetical protein LBD72_00025 [Puniceicoccales bacterium]|nr:hypothetical protein [Puniceicoccales bacterium]